jgi:hypothetical protein
MQVTIDRFEGKIAVCEKADRTMINIPRDKLPAEAKEGEILIIEGNDIKIDSAATDQRRKMAEELRKGLFQK